MNTRVLNSIFVLLLLATPAAAQTINAGNNGPWFKADLHTHYSFRSPIEEEIARYRETGYNFLVLSAKDDSKVIDYEKYSTPGMLIVNGVEQSFLTRKNKLGHVIGFRIKSPFMFTSAWTLKEGYAKLREKNKRAILGINHPHDGRWSLDDVLEAAEQGLSFFELNSIDMKHGEFETALWDQALSRGARLYATLVNDVHSFGDIDAYGYILIRAAALDYGKIAPALLSGDFYAVESGCSAKVEEYRIIDSDAGKRLRVSAPGAARIRAIGDGKVFADRAGPGLEVSLADSFKYVRVELIDAEGRYIFMQPFFLGNK